MVINSVRPSCPCLSYVVLLRRFQIHPPSFMTKTIDYNVLHFDSKCCESHLSLSLYRFVQVHPLTTATNNRMNSVLFMLQSIVYKVHSLSTDLNRIFVQRLSLVSIKPILTTRTTNFEPKQSD